MAFLRSEILRVGAEEAAVALDDLCGRAEQADPRARDALAAAVPLLTDASLAEIVIELRSLARAKALLPLSRLLRGKGARRAGMSGKRGSAAAGVDMASGPASSIEGSAPPADERKVMAVVRGRTLTLGERKALARKLRGGALLDKLLCDPHPLVIRNLLSNPRVTEDDVVRLAARRPAYPDIIGEIARSPTWTLRPRVRMAILLNPGSPPEVTVPMVRLLIRPELGQVAAATDIPPVVRTAARELLERRPPLPEKSDPGAPTQ